jgi:hypothetical protein
MTEREQYLFDALRDIRKAVADKKDDCTALEVAVYRLATKAVRGVHSITDGTALPQAHSGVQ